MNSAIIGFILGLMSLPVFKSILRGRLKTEMTLKVLRDQCKHHVDSGSPFDVYQALWNIVSGESQSAQGAYDLFIATELKLNEAIFAVSGKTSLWDYSQDKSKDPQEILDVIDKVRRSDNSQ